MEPPRCVSAFAPRAPRRRARAAQPRRGAVPAAPHARRARRGPYTHGRMDRVPSELDDLLNARGRRLLARAPQFESMMAKRQTPIVFFENVIDRGVARECVQLLDEALYPLMRRMDVAIPRERVTEMTTNYTEGLGKTVRVAKATVHSGPTKVH